jgi:mannose-6-phosphate isomerase-like protein (cupin superfamily)
MSFRRVTAFERSGVPTLTVERIERMEAEGIDNIWRADTALKVPNDGKRDSNIGFPAPGGVWVFAWVLDAGETGEKDNGIVEMDSSAPGFHRTDSIDVHVLLEGTLVLELADGDEIELEVGDAVVVNGNRHRWHNRGDRRSRALTTVYGAARN